MWYRQSLAVNPQVSDQVVVAHQERAFARLAAGQWQEVGLIGLADDPAWLAFWVGLLSNPGSILLIGIALSVMNWTVVPWRAAQGIGQVVIILGGLFFLLAGSLVRPHALAYGVAAGSALAIVTMLAMRLGYLLWAIIRSQRTPDDRATMR